MSRVLDATWWRSIAGALLRTALAALVPFIPALVADPAATWRVAALTLGLVLVLAIASALGSLPDLATGTWWEIAIQRSLRQFGQMVAAAAASAALLTDVHWRAVLVAAAGSALSTLVIAALASLPPAPVFGAVEAIPVLTDPVSTLATGGLVGPGFTVSVHPAVPDLGKPIPGDVPRHLA